MSTRKRSYTDDDYDRNGGRYDNNNSYQPDGSREYSNARVTNSRGNERHHDHFHDREHHRSDRKYTRHRHDRRHVKHHHQSSSRRRKASYDGSKRRKLETRTSSPRSSVSGGSDSSVDDTVGHLNPRVDGSYIIDNRYTITKQLGVGTFGKVYQCSDKKYQDVVAIKVIRNIKRYLHSAEVEADILNAVCSAVKKSKAAAAMEVAGNNSDNNSNMRSVDSATNCVDNSDNSNFGLMMRNRHRYIVKLYSSFYDQSHFCMVQEPLGISLYEYIKHNRYVGMPLPVVRHIAFQLFSALSFLHDVVGLVHTDLKLENILFVPAGGHHIKAISSDRQDDDTVDPADIVQVPKHRSILNTWTSRVGSRNVSKDRNSSSLDSTRDYYLPRQSMIKIIDFGGATYINEKRRTNVINTRQYRGPEVICWENNPTGHGLWNEKTDIWSAGCILSECYTGDLLFPTHNDIEHLAMIERLARDYIRTAWGGGENECASVFPASITDKMSESMIEKYFVGTVDGGSNTGVHYHVNVEKLSLKHKNNVADLVLLSESLIPVEERIEGGGYSNNSNSRRRDDKVENLFVTQNVANYLAPAMLESVYTSLVSCPCGCQVLYNNNVMDSNGNTARTCSNSNSRSNSRSRSSRSNNNVSSKEEDSTVLMTGAPQTHMTVQMQAQVVAAYSHWRFHDLLAACLAVDPAERISATNAMLALPSTHSSSL